MALMIPSSPAGSLPPAVLKTFNFLKGLPDDFSIWHHLAPWQKDAPDFLILDQQGRALILKISSASPNEARPAAQLLLLDDHRPPLSQSEANILNRFLEACAIPTPAFGASAPTVAILFPNIADKPLQASRPESPDRIPAWLGKEWLQPDQACRWSTLLSGPALEPADLERLRLHFTPESVVPAELTVRQPDPRRLQAGLTAFLLDYDQEAAAKSELDLPAEGQSTGRDFNLRLVNGVAGSGKTLILLYRLRLLHSLYPQKRFLVLTHNRPLNHDMQARFHRLHGSLPENIEWDTFNGWVYRHWPANPAWIEPLGYERRKRFIRAVWLGLFHHKPEGELISENLLQSEFDWIKDQPELSRADYLQASRRGRGMRLNSEQRQLVYTAFERYQAVLAEKRQVDWGDTPRRMWSFIDRGLVQPAVYDVILIDEAQFFAPVWFEIIQRLLRPSTGHLFLSADPTQGFLRGGASWKSVGLDVRGRSHHLKRSYRTTGEILNFATLFYRQRIPSDDPEDEVLVPDLYDMPGGAVPQLIQLESPQDEIARIANEISALVKKGLPRGQILALHANWQGVRDLILALERRLGKMAAADPKDQYPGNYIRVTTLNAGAGLESPVVFLAGLYDLFEEEQSLRLADREREQLILENTRKVYMAATRAGQRLVFTYVGPLPDELKALATG